MNILTDEEIEELYFSELDNRELSFARAIEAAVLAKLAAQDVEPVAWVCWLENDDGAGWKITVGSKKPAWVSDIRNCSVTDGANWPGGELITIRTDSAGSVTGPEITAGIETAAKDMARAAWDHQQQRIPQLETIIKRQNFVEDRYEELHTAARRCLRYHGVDAEMHNAAMRAMDTLIQRHIGEINEMEEGE